MVGESGSGKSVTALALMRLHPGNAITTGAVDFDGHDLLHMSDSDMRSIRGNHIAMIFQDPMTAMNPVFTVGESDRRDDPRPRLLGLEEGCLEQGGRPAAAGRRARTQAPGIAVPARVLRRHAPAGDDRHGHRQRPEAADRRRADDGARRHGAGPGDGGAARGAGADRLRDDADHPRPRTRRRLGRPRAGDVREPVDGDRHDRSRSSTSRRIRTPGHCSSRSPTSTVSRNGSSRFPAIRRAC